MESAILRHRAHARASSWRTSSSLVAENSRYQRPTATNRSGVIGQSTSSATRGECSAGLRRRDGYRGHGACASLAHGLNRRAHGRARGQAVVDQDRGSSVQLRPRAGHRDRAARGDRVRAPARRRSARSVPSSSPPRRPLPRSAPGCRRWRSRRKRAPRVGAPRASARAERPTAPERECRPRRPQARRRAEAPARSRPRARRTNSGVRRAVARRHGGPRTSRHAHVAPMTYRHSAPRRRSRRRRPAAPLRGYQYSGAKCTNVLPRCSVQSWKAWASLIVTRFSVPQCGQREVPRRSPGRPLSVISSGAGEAHPAGEAGKHDRRAVVLTEPCLILNRRAHPSGRTLTPIAGISKKTFDA